MKYPTNWNNPRRTPQVRRLTVSSVLCALLAVTVGLLPATTFAACYVDANGNTVCTPRQPVRRFVQAVTPRPILSVFQDVAPTRVYTTPQLTDRAFPRRTPRNERSIVRSYTVVPATSYGSSGPAAAYQSSGSAGGTVYQSSGSNGGNAAYAGRYDLSPAGRVIASPYGRYQVVSAPVVKQSLTTQGDCPCGPDCNCCADLQAENAKLKAELAELRGELAASKAASAPVTGAVSDQQSAISKPTADSPPPKAKRPAPPKYSSLHHPPAYRSWVGPTYAMR